ncbi:hypothetical protein M4L90_09600 [Staphylococcus equorum]|uniref:Lipoprotein n=1 Tax=Staphylococcus equorum TaxID=246432 RepID=A0A9X4L4M2_9STAP|nr:hypothetical protein [Staphylococcus equorum]ALM56691.1 hypothetical protein SE1039_09080 [Staphylococcus equorum]MDG0819934.1 hypothetical protein [Staphylococcus equorum]MDG0840793.1 hypothetical protein [Staphylococcus equorum]MDG0846258.1 hypothetical protein [Staphylococcus equorum]
MKKLIFLVIPALVLMLAGCSKAESEDKEQKTEGKQNTQTQEKQKQDINKAKGTRK